MVKYYGFEFFVIGCTKRANGYRMDARTTVKDVMMNNLIRSGNFHHPFSCKNRINWLGRNTNLWIEFIKVMEI